MFCYRRNTVIINCDKILDKFFFLIIEIAEIPCKSR